MRRLHGRELGSELLNTHFRGWRPLPAGYNVMGASLDRGRPQSKWRVHPEHDFFVHEKAYKLGPTQRRLLGLGDEAFPPVDGKGQLRVAGSLN